MTEQKNRKPGGPDGHSRARLLAGLGPGGGHGRADRPGDRRASTRPRPPQAEPKVLSGDVEITLKVNGQDRTCTVEPRSTLLDTLAPPARRDRPQAGLRPRQLRRLHDDRRRRPGLLLHDAGRLLPGQDDRDPGELRHRRARRAPRLPPERRPDVRLLHARVRHRLQGAPRQEPQPDARRGQARGSTATSAVAARTSASSQAALAAAKAMKGA